jgi:hypothetical protein
LFSDFGDRQAPLHAGISQMPGEIWFASQRLQLHLDELEGIENLVILKLEINGQRPNPRGIALEIPLTNCSGLARRGDDRFYRLV